MIFPASPGWDEVGTRLGCACARRKVQQLSESLGNVSVRPTLGLFGELFQAFFNGAYSFIRKKLVKEALRKEALRLQLCVLFSLPGFQGC